MSAQRGNRVKLSTFNSWGKSGVIGKKTEVDDDGTTYVNFVWCLLCTKNEKKILDNPRLKMAHGLVQLVCLTLSDRHV